MSTALQKTNLQLPKDLEILVNSTYLDPQLDWCFFTSVLVSDKVGFPRTMLKLKIEPLFQLYFLG